MEQRPNILWYCTDQQRYDTIASLGNPYINTPNLDRLAAGGTAFERAYCQCPICTPSRATFLTGRYPASHHVHRNGNDVFPDHEILVTRLLADAGYDCGLAGKLHLSRACGRVEKRPRDGYRVFHWSHHPKPDWPEGHDYDVWLRSEKGIDPRELFAASTPGAYGAGVPAACHQTTWCTEMALRFLDEPRDGPWLLCLNPFDPHPPFDPPAEYLERYDPATLPLPLFRENDLLRQEQFAHIDQQTRVAVDPRMTGAGAEPGKTEGPAHSNPPSRYDARMVKACYYAMIELIDEQFGRLLDALEDRGELANTIVVFTSDHGELLGDHGLLYKGCRFFEGLVHVPLIISWPEQFRQGCRSRALVELVDLAPTLLDAVGLPVPQSMQGRSLAPLLRGDVDAHTHKKRVICEFNDALDMADGTHATMVFDGRWKSIVYHGHGLGEIFDLEEDPGEFNNLWDHPALGERTCDLLLQHLDAMAATSSAGIPRTGRF